MFRNVVIRAIRATGVFRVTATVGKRVLEGHSNH